MRVSQRYSRGLKVPSQYCSVRNAQNEIYDPLTHEVLDVNFAAYTNAQGERDEDEIEDKHKIRTVTVDGDESQPPVYYCYHVKSLYDWTHRQNKPYDPVTKGAFDATQLKAIESAFKRSQGTIALLDPANPFSGIIVDNKVDPPFALTTGSCFTVSQPPNRANIPLLFEGIKFHYDTRTEMFNYSDRTIFYTPYRPDQERWSEGVARRSMAFDDFLAYFDSVVECPPVPPERMRLLRGRAESKDVYF